jgi:hypothetical protein
MRSVEFLYWLLGGIELGSMKEQNEDTKEIILKHIAMVEAYKPNRQDSYNNIVMMIKGLVNLGSINEDNWEDLCIQIEEELPKKMEHMGNTLLPYYIQGAFELCEKISDIRLSDTVITTFPMCALHRSIVFYFFVSDRKDSMSVAELEKLKIVIANIFRQEIDPGYGDQIAELNAIHNPKPNKLKPVDHGYSDDYDHDDYSSSGSEIYRC